jgi:ATP-dependent DNA helicase RecG
MDLNTPIEKIYRVGPNYKKRLEKLNIKTVEDLIFHFPHRYNDFSNLVKISDAKEGILCSFQGKITDIRNLRTPKRRMMITQAEVSDESGKVKVIWFNQPYLINSFKKGDNVSLAGKVVKKQGVKYLSNPIFEKIPDDAESLELLHTGRLVPVYPETESVSSKWLRYVIKPALSQIKNKLSETIPLKILKKLNLPHIKEAIWQIHFPETIKEAETAKKRFAFEELFLLSLYMLKERLRIKQEKAIPIPVNLEVLQKFIKSLPFELTNAQKKAAWQILKDMEKPIPMNRLLEGDVGSGKTIVAAIAALNTIKAGFQVAFMAPTEILARQHFENLNKLLSNFDIKLGLMTGKEKTTGEFDLIIGTHALIQDKVEFKNLTLVIIDEQHRFGVEQRAKLVRKGNKNEKQIPHLLSITATPIPRTLALTIYGDLDLSLLNEMPPGRKKIITKIVYPKEKKKIYEFIEEKVREGNQVFVICPRIESKNSSKDLQEGEGEFDYNYNQDKRLISWNEVKAVKEEYEKLKSKIFPNLNIAMLHGKMKSKEKEEIMNNFKSGKIDILVSTSVVEVGVDIPNATIMIIEGAEKFGLAQLHQFRGRVGRSDKQSYCFLFTESNLPINNRRLRAFVSIEDGFKLAEQDLKIRGPGDLIGQRQWGIPSLTMASLTEVSLVESAREAAKEIIEEDPDLKKYPSLKERLKSFTTKIHLE